MNTKRTVVTAGYVPLDIVRYQNRTWHSAGGSAGNIAAILSFLGWGAAVVAELGDDLAGQAALRDLRVANVSLDAVRLRPDVNSARLIYEIGPGGHRYLWRCPECNQSLPTSRPLRLDRAAELAKLLPVPDVFFLDRINAGTLLLAEHFEGLGSFIVLEPSRPARPAFTERALAVADLVKYADNRDAGIDEITAVRANQIRMVTSGSKGAQFRIGSGAWHTSPAFAYPIVDAGGAGDWTTAGFVHALQSGKRSVRSVGDALRWAQALAAVSCGAPGARGLARQQSADAVVRAAQFLQHSQSDASPIAASAQPQGIRVPRASCRCCLQALANVTASSNHRTVACSGRRAVAAKAL